MIRQIVIYGAGGMGREIKTMIDHINKAARVWDIIGYVDDHIAAGTNLNGTPVVGGIDFFKHRKVYAVIGVGLPAIRKLIIEKLKAYQVDFATLIHPSVIIGDETKVHVGVGTMICAGTVITTDVHIGEHVIVNLSCTIGHDVKINSFASIMPGVDISGEVSIGYGAFIGSGTTIINKKKIGDHSIVGAGSVIIRDVEPGAKVVGVPGRIIGKV